MRRLPELDSLRGVAALVVLVAHYFTLTRFWPQDLHDTLALTPFNIFLTGRPPVILFFVLSGYVLALRIASLGVLSGREHLYWAMQRSIRLGLPAAASLLLSVGLYRAVFNGAQPLPPFIDMWNLPPTLAAFLTQATLTSLNDYDINGVLWSLAPEWRLSVLLPLTAYATRCLGRDGAAAVLLIGLGLHGFAHGSGIADPMQDGTMFGELRLTLAFVLPFAGGVALAMHPRAAPQDISPAPALVTAMLFAVVGLGQFSVDLSATLASMLLVWLAQQPGWLRAVLRGRRLAYAGKLSFSLYLLHLPVLGASIHALNGTLPIRLSGAVGIALTFAAAWAFHLGVDRPAIRLARRFRVAGRAQPKPRDTMGLR